MKTIALVFLTFLSISALAQTNSSRGKSPNVLSESGKSVNTRNDNSGLNPMLSNPKATPPAPRSNNESKPVAPYVKGSHYGGKSKVEGGVKIALPAD